MFKDDFIASARAHHLALKTLRRIFARVCSFFSKTPTRVIPSCEKLREVADKYFASNPMAKDGVMKAFYAYHADGESRLNTHLFVNGVCRRCGRSREQVRHDDLPPDCMAEFGGDAAQRVILDEETRFNALLARAEKEIPPILRRRGLSGTTLAFLHDTLGYDPETVALCVDVPVEMISDYHLAMDDVRARSRSAQKKTVVMAVGI